MTMLVGALLLIGSTISRITLHERDAELPASCTRIKTLHVIRHAEGHHNADELAVERSQMHLKDPEHVRLRDEYGIAWVLLERVSGRRYHDPLLTAKGREQAYALRAELRREPGFAVDMVAFSPMRRTISTALLGLPQLEGIAAAFPLDSPEATMLTPRLVASDLLRERVGPFMCDSRMSRSELEAEYSRLGGNESVRIDFSGVSEADIMFAEGAERREPEVGSTVLARRASAALEWLSIQPEQSIALVAHKHFLGALTSLHAATVVQRPFENAEKRTMLLCVEKDAAWDEAAASHSTHDGASSTVRPIRARVQTLGMQDTG